MHWRNDEEPHAVDVMEPILSAYKVALSRSTVAAIEDSRGANWRSLACWDAVSHCPQNHTCTGAQQHLPGWCLR